MSDERAPAPAAPQGASREGAASEDEATGLPGFRTWRAVYLTVLASFLVWVGLLCLLSWSFR